MKVTLLQEKLKQGLQKLERVSSKSTTYPILSAVLLDVKKNFLRLSATDLEIGINWWMLAKTEKEGQTVVPLAPFSGFLEFLPNKPITLSQKEGYLIVECGNYQTQIKTLPTDDFPLIPEVPGETFLEMKTTVFCQGLSHLSEIASLTQTRPELSGVLLSFQKDALKMAATDSFRLGEKTIFANDEELATEGFSEASLIIPQKTAKEINALFGERHQKMKIRLSPNQIMCEAKMQETDHPEIHLVSRLVEGEYPAYQEIIPKKHDAQAVLDKSEFLNHLKAAAIFSGKINEITLKINPKESKVEFFSQNPDLGEHHSFMQGKIKGDPLEISFNHWFLSSGLSNIKSSEVVFELQKNEGPATLKPLGDQTYLYVVMPIKAS